MDRPSRSAVAVLEPPPTALFVYEVDAGRPIYGYLLPLDEEVRCEGMCWLPGQGKQGNLASIIWDAGSPMECATECADCMKQSMVEFYGTRCLA